MRTSAGEAQILLDQSVMWLRKVTDFVGGCFVKFVFLMTKLTLRPSRHLPWP